MGTGKLSGSCLSSLLFGLAVSGDCLAQSEERGERGIIVAPAKVKPAPGAPTVPDAPPELRILPPVDELGETLSTIDSIRVARIQVEGNTLLPDSEIADLVAPYENRLIRSGELHELRYKLSLLYFNHGYVTSGVIIPDQKVEDGVIRLQAIEGRLTKVEIVGNERLRESYLRERLDLDPDAPVNTKEIQKALQVLQSNPRIRQVNAQLLPGVNRGESLLRVNIAENQNYWFQVRADNYRSPSVGEERLSLYTGHSNLTGNGDEVALNIGLTEGLNDYGISYAYPLTRKDLVLKGYYSRTDSGVIEPPFNLIDITSETETWGISLSRPFRLDSGRLLVASAGFEHKHGTNTLLGTPFSFSPGERDGKSALSVLVLSAEWLWQQARQALGISAGIRRGVDALDATVHANDPDSKFISYQGQIQLARKLAWRNSQLVLRFATQLTPDSLLPLEKFAVGGNATVRGYRENTYVRDNGFAASAELRIPLLVDDDGVDLGNVAIVPFVDYGSAWDTNNALPTSKWESLYSLGLGFRWAIDRSWFFQAAYGHAKKDVNYSSQSLQDKGFHFQLTYSLLAN